MSSTRLLMLGVLRLLQPAHGYRIRRQLESWQADEWANVAFGSIYFSLRKMEQEGLVQAVAPEEPAERRGRTSYIVTDVGEQEFHRLLEEQWSAREPIVDPFMAGLAFMQSVSRSQILDYLRARRNAALTEAKELENNSKLASPPHVAELLLLPASRLRAEAAWADAAIIKVERGELP